MKMVMTMKMRIGSVLLCALCLVQTAESLASEDDVDKAIANAVQFGRDLAFVETRELGKAVVALGTAEDRNPDKALEKARQQANVVMAGFLSGKAISALDSSSIQAQGQDVLITITSQSTISVDSLLNGAQVYKIGSLDENTWFVALVIAEKSQEFANVLEQRTFESTIQAKGFSSAGEDATDFRRRALADALRNAVEAFAGVSVAAKSYVRNADEIQSNIAAVSNGRVKRYQVVDEFKSNGQYIVVIVAEIEERPPGADDNIQALLENMGRPSFFVVSNYEEATILLRNLLTSLGFDLASSEQNCRYKLEGQIDFVELPVRYGNGEHYSTRTNLTLLLKQPLNSDVLFSISNTMDDSVDISRYPEIGRRNSVSYAVEEISDPLAQELKSLMVDEFQHGTKILVALEDWFGLRDVDAFESCLESMPDVQSVSQFPIEKDRVARFEIIYRGDPGGLQVDFKKHSLSCDNLGKLRVRKDADGRIVFAM
jgi:hypothetical protein